MPIRLIENIRHDANNALQKTDGNITKSTEIVEEKYGTKPTENQFPWEVVGEEAQKLGLTQ